MNENYGKFADTEEEKYIKTVRALKEHSKSLDTHEKRIDFLVRTGIYNYDGTLTEVYRNV